MITLPLKHIATTTLTLVLVSQVANAIVFRHDVLEQDYIDLAKPYNSVGRAGGVGSGTGFLASPTKFITAAHVVDGNKDGIADNVTFNARFSTTGSGFHNTYTPSSVDVHPLYSSNSRYDIAVFTFSTPITGYTPMEISSESPFGLLATMVGYGINGSGDTFDYPDNYGFDNTRRAANNIIDTQDSRFYLTDFDRVSEDTSTYGSATPLALEGTSARGDSGGPIIVDGSVVGIVQGGYSNPITGRGESEYGDRATWVRLNDPDNLSFLASHGLTPVPEPSVLAMGLISLLVLVRRRRSRR